MKSAEAALTFSRYACEMFILEFDLHHASIQRLYHEIEFGNITNVQGLTKF